MQFYSLLRQLLFRLEAERAHTTVTRFWNVLMRIPGTGLLTAHLRYHHPSLATTVSGLTFRNPVGLAGGFDKDGLLVHAFTRLGFGFLELGTVTPRPQAGNPRPRMFRLIEDEALINRLGFNNQGATALHGKLVRAKRRVPIGVNIGKNRDTPVEHAVDDYLICFRALGPIADYVTINVSSPNTPGLRDLQRSQALEAILSALIGERNEVAIHGAKRAVPIFVKLSPDETPAHLDAALAVILQTGADGIIATNTTVSRSAELQSSQALQEGGISGRPLTDRSTAVVRYLYRAVDGQLPIIGVGGIDSATSAYQKILAGSSLVQLYTALIYQGPGLVANILRNLVGMLQADGFDNIAQAIGQETALGREY